MSRKGIVPTMSRKKSARKPTQAQLAAILGISRQLLYEHIQSGNAPPIGDVTAWVEYMAARGNVATSPPDMRRKIADQRLRILTETAERLARENQVGRKELISLPEAERLAAEAERFYWAEIDRMVREMPPALCGLSAGQIHGKLSAFVDEMKKRSRAMFAAVSCP